MHINPNFLKNLEELCLKQQNYQNYQNYNSRFHRNHRNFESFGYCEDLKDIHHENTSYKRYDLSNIHNDNDLKMCLGLEFLDMDLSMFTMSNKKRGIAHYLDVDNEDSQLMPFMMKKNKDISKEEIIKTIGYKMMNFERTIRILDHVISEIFMAQNILNYKPLVDEWLSFSKNIM